jgi:hypothetical protein
MESFGVVGVVEEEESSEEETTDKTVSSRKREFMGKSGG